MDINAAASLQAMVENNPYKPKQSTGKNEGNFEKVLSEVSLGEKKNTAKDTVTQEVYESVFPGAAVFNQIAMTQSVSESSEGLVKGVTEELFMVTDNQQQLADFMASVAFGDVSDAFSDMIVNQVIQQYVDKYMSESEGADKPTKAELTEKVSDAFLNVVEDYSGFTKTQMLNPNMTADIVGLEKYIGEDFADDLANEIISITFEEFDVDTSEAETQLKNTLTEALTNIQNVSQNVSQNAVQDTASDNISTAPLPNLNGQSVSTQKVSETGERLITMSDGTLIPESKIQKSSNIPDENGIYPEGTEYIPSTPFIGKGDSPAEAVLLAKIGDEDGLVTPSDFVAARNINFTKHENVPEVFGDAVYIPYQGAVAGVIEYAGSENSMMNSETDSQSQSGGFEFASQNTEFSNFMISPVNQEINQVNVDFEIPADTPNVSNTLTQMVERMTSNLINTQDSTVKQMEIQLHPETLGNIVIKLESVQGELNVKIITSNPEVRDIIAQTAMQMSDSIRSQGVNLSNIDVSYSSQNQSENFDGSSGNSAYYNNSGNNQNNQQDENQGSYREYMEAAENEKIRRVLDSIMNSGL